MREKITLREDAPDLGPLPVWCYRDDLGNLVPSDIRVSVNAERRRTYALGHAAGVEAGVPAGWRLVPIDATAPMRAACRAAACEQNGSDWIWTAMLAASPTPPAPAGVEAGVPARAVMQQALDALEAIRPQNMGPQVYPAIASLRAALAAPPQAAPALTPAQPYFISGPYQDGTFGICEMTTSRIVQKLAADELPAQAASTRQPLLSADIVTMYAECPRSDSEMIDFARAIEAAHGIGPAPAQESAS